MAEQAAGEKNLPASPRKLEQAREKGQVAKSQDLNSSVGLLAALLALWVFGPNVMEQLRIITEYFCSEAYALSGDPQQVRASLLQAAFLVGPALIPLMLVISLAGVAINLAQFGILFSSQALAPKLDRINPLSGFKRYFSLRTFVELIKSILKLSIITYVVWVSVRSRTDEILSLVHLSAWDAGVAVWMLVVAVWWRIALAMLALGLLDFGFQRWQFLQDQRMTQQEAKEELKQLEGDPQIRQRIKNIQRQMAMQRMMGDVGEADVVITNPTTFAVAIRYDAERMQAPEVIAKGARLVAERIRDLAVENDVPIVERPELARLLYRTIEVGQPVPDKLFRAVAEILAYVYQIDRREEKIQERLENQPMAPAAV